MNAIISGKQHLRLIIRKYARHVKVRKFIGLTVKEDIPENPGQKLDVHIHRQFTGSRRNNKRREKNENCS